MPYERVWVPELNAYKIVGEMTGEELLQSMQNLPAGATQWGWNAQSGTFAYGTQYESRQEVYEQPPIEMTPFLVDLGKVLSVPSLAPAVAPQPSTGTAIGMATGMGVMATLLLIVFAMGKGRK